MCLCNGDYNDSIDINNKNNLKNDYTNSYDVNNKKKHSNGDDNGNCTTTNNTKKQRENINHNRIITYKKKTYKIISPLFHL